MRIPSLAAIQRTNALVGIAACIALLGLYSQAAALACLLGTAVVMADLWLLAWLGRLLLQSASRHGGSSRGVIALPLKLLLIAGLVYLLFYREGIDPVGFAIGVATQLLAILIATTRAAWHPDLGRVGA